MPNTTIQLKRSSSSSNTPTVLDFGELAINYTDGKLFYKHSNGTIVSFSSGSGGDSFGTINANGTLVVADTPGDILNLVAGNNITFGVDAVNDIITINASGGGGDVSAPFAAANAAFLAANSAFANGNTTHTLAITSFGAANASFANGNTNFTTLQTVFGVANAGFLAANSAFANANGTHTLTVASFGAANAAFANANSTHTLTIASFAAANASFANGNTNFTTLQTVFGAANAAFSNANTTHTLAIAALTQANTANNLTVANTGTVVGSRNVLNFIPGANVVITFTDDAVGNRVNVSIDSVSSGGGGSGALSYTTNIGDNSANTFNITHALNTTTIIPAVREIASGYYVYPDMKVTSPNNIVLEFVSAPTTDQYFLILLGA